MKPKRRAKAAQTFKTGDMVTPTPDWYGGAREAPLQKGEKGEVVKQDGGLVYVKFPSDKGKTRRMSSTTLVKASPVKGKTMKPKRRAKAAPNPKVVTDLKTMGILPEGENPADYPAIGPDDTWSKLDAQKVMAAKKEIIATLIKAGRPDLANEVARSSFGRAVKADAHPLYNDWIQVTFENKGILSGRPSKLIAKFQNKKHRDKFIADFTNQHTETKIKPSKDSTHYVATLVKGGVARSPSKKAAKGERSVKASARGVPVTAMPETPQGKKAAGFIQKALKELNALEREWDGDPDILEETKNSLLDAAAGTLKL